jgi:WD40-like Beta Propeller Repeat
MYIRRVSWLITAALIASNVNEAAGQTVPVAVSVSTEGTPGNSNSLMPAMSATGRYVAFMSFASNLVANDTNGERDVFLRDRDTDADGVFDEPGAVATIRVSERQGDQGNGPSEAPAITPDGRYVVFTSFASNLFAFGQPPLTVSVVLRWDRLTGDLLLVSQTTDGQPLLGLRSVDPDVSDDGNHIVFTYGGSVPSEVDAGFAGVIYHRDAGAGTLTQVVNTQIGPEGSRFHMGTPSISGDGATIAYGLRIVSGGATLIALAHVVDAATNTIRAAYVGTQPRLSRDGASLVFIDGPVAAPAVHIHLATGERRRSIAFLSGDAQFVTLSPSGRYLLADNLLVDFHYGSQLSPSLGQPDAAAFDAADSRIAYRQGTQVVAGSLAPMLDADNDGLNGHWEAMFGLDPNAGGVSGATGDPDGDGVTNAEEFARGSNPRGTLARYLAEGATGTFFDTRYAIANPNPTAATVAIRLALDGGGIERRHIWIEPGRPVTIDSRAQDLGTASFSAVFESDLPVVVDRLMSWSDAQGIPYGSHAETSSAAPGTSWFLAEGSTVLGFQLFYLLQNPQPTPTTATIRYLLPSGAPIVRTYDLPAQSRTTVYVNTVPGLESTDVSADITATQPIAVERAMYRSGGGQVFALGHDAAAVPGASATWFFGEGSTGAFFDTYLLLANPSAQPASVQVDYLRDQGGTVSRTYTVPANSRFSVYVDGEPGMEGTAFGTRVVSSVPIVAERAMYWAGGFFDYYEGHVSAGATQAGSHWVLATGEQGGPNVAQTYVLVANTGPAAATVRIRSLPETGAAETSGLLQVPGHARLTFPLSMFPGFIRGGTEVVEEGSSTGALVVEGSIYWNTPGQIFGAGANWPATRIP